VRRAAAATLFLFSLLFLVVASTYPARALDGDADFTATFNTALRGSNRSSIQIARGKVPGWSKTNKFGENADVDAQEDIWDDDGLYVPPTSAMIHSVISTSTADDAGSTGALTLTIQGLDASWLAIEETVTLDGQTAVPTVNAYLRINRAWVATAGSGGVNAGAVSITMRNDPVTVSALVGAGNGQTLMAVYSLPDACKAYVTRVRSALVRNTGSNNAADLRLIQRSNLDASPSHRVMDSWSVSVNGATNHEYTYDPPKTLTGPCDVFIRAEAVTAANTILSASFDLIEIADTAE